jgi:hypothetical protein
MLAHHPTTDIKRDYLRHFLATIAYRARKTILRAPPGFEEFDAGHGVRRPVEILSHMSSVLSHAQSFFVSIETKQIPIGTWEQEAERFFRVLSELDKSLESRTGLRGRTEEQLLQGPFTDVMTHIGQLAMLRRMSSAPIPKEDFDEAAIHVGDVGLHSAR